MQHESLKAKAAALQELRVIQQKLALAGQYKDAILLGRKIRVHTKQVVKAYLGVKDIPDAPNAFLVKEICLHLAQTGTDNNALRSRLRIAAWSEEQDVTKKLEQARAALPDLKKVEEALR